MTHDAKETDGVPDAARDAQNALLGLLSECDGRVLVTLKADGRPQLSNVNHAYYPDERTVRVSITERRAKTRNMRRGPRVSYHVTSGDRWTYTVVEGTADLTPCRAGTAVVSRRWYRVPAACAPLASLGVYCSIR